MIIRSGLRILLSPLACIYGIIIHVRNFLFDKKILRSRTFPLPLICIGNLSTGGTGKTPMTEYLIQILKNNFSIATLSRGYKRKTKGVILAGEADNSDTIGDEPMQFHQKFPGIQVVVGENRSEAIDKLLSEKRDIQAIILDDGFQHRKVVAGLNILLTSYTSPFFQDYFLPAGRLRDQRNAYRRAQIIIVSKCPDHLSFTEKEWFIRKIKPADHQSVYFTKIVYQNPYHLIAKNEIILSAENNILLIHGIARPASLRNYLHKFDQCFQEIAFPDHYDFTARDVVRIRQRFGEIESENKIILATEKDAAKLFNLKSDLVDLPLYILPIGVQFLFGEKEQFAHEVNTFVTSFNDIYHA